MRPGACVQFELPIRAVGAYRLRGDMRDGVAVQASYHYQQQGNELVYYSVVADSTPI
jgi:hypothetical protein